MHKGRKKRLVNYAKVLIVISITLFVYGFSLDFYNKNIKKVIDPIKDVKQVNGNNNTVSITPSTGSEVVPNDNSDNKTVENKTVPSNKDINNELRNEIQNRYDVKVLYGSETNGYVVKSDNTSISTTPITDSNKIYSKLNDLNRTLSLYPKGMFSEIKNGGIPLTIILIDSYSESNITGVTDSSYEYANISIAAMYPFDESFYHESYHYIERYMFKKGANFNSWDTLNPSGFNWNTIDGSLSYSNTFSENAPFVNNYAQTAAAEDRASTFEYMMANSKASCLNRGTTVWKKANYMSQMMRQVLTTVRNNSNVRWEQYLY